MSSQDMRQMTGLGRKIETGSFAVIDAEVGPHSFDEAHWQVVRRVIHATADFEFKELMEFHPDGLASGIAALRRGAPVTGAPTVLCSCAGDRDDER